MGGTASTYNACEQLLFGWFTDSQVTCVRGKGAGSVQLTSLENAPGMKLLFLAIDANSAVVVEDRRVIDYDRYLQKEGPVVYLIDIRIKTVKGFLKYYLLTQTTIQKRCSVKYGSVDNVWCIAVKSLHHLPAAARLPMK